MVIAWALAGCDGIRPTPNTILGLQVVAIQNEPAEPAPLEGLRLTSWVADGIGAGADVLVWVCTPVDGRCAEVFPPGSTGLPLSLWTRTGRAAPTFTTDTPWAWFAGLADQNLDLPEEYRGKLLVWTLACVPGVCDVIDRVAADPVSGSEAWMEVTAMLGDPTTWIGDLPDGQVSLAAKLVPVYLGDDPGGTDYVDYGYGTPTTVRDGQNHNPTLTPLVHDASDRVTFLDFVDPDGDPLTTARSFVTAGGVTWQASDTDLTVQWQEPLRARTGDLFVVAEDGRGGTAVWSTATDPCDAQTTAVLGGTRPFDPGDEVLLTSFGGAVWGIEVPFVVTSADPVRVVTFEVWQDDARLGRQERPIDGLAPGCPPWNERQRIGIATSLDAACDVIGTVVHLTMTVDEPLGQGLAAEDAVDLVVKPGVGLVDVCDQPTR
ncbi:MAG: hypothetical protein ABMB14_09405 [Myxococcota bacterium]